MASLSHFWPLERKEAERCEFLFLYFMPTVQLCCVMDMTKTALERAFELAKSGKFATPGEIKEALRGEKYSIETVTGGALTKQLRGLIASSR